MRTVEPDRTARLPRFSAHSTLGYKIEGQDVSIYDHYEPAGKTLQSGYPIPYALQGIVTITPPVAPTPPATTYPPNPRRNRRRRGMIGL